MFNLPHYVAVSYERNPETGYFTKTAEQPDLVPFNRAPYELKVESTQQPDIRTNARLIIRGKEKSKSGKNKFLTGMVEVVNGANWFVGDHYQNGKKSLVIFCFSQHNRKLHLFYFPGFDKRSIPERVEFAKRITPHLMNQLIGNYEGVL